jgi:tripartite-type tricarboxylate transporter receptor subunit TctC
MCFFALTSAPRAQGFFDGKTINIIVGFTAGGGYDVTARLYSRHFGRHIPGSPTIVVNNMPGGGSIVAANSLYSGPGQDGTRLGIIAGGAIIEPLLSDKARYDARRFNWIGGRSTEPSVCAIWHTSKVKSYEDALKIEVVVGASGPGSRTVTYPKLLNQLTGTKFKVVTGYPGGNEIALAMERGEVESHCGLAWGSAKTRLAEWISSKKIHFIAQFALTRAADLPDVPLASDFASNERDRKAIEFLMSDALLAWPLLAPPEVPTDRVDTLRKGFEAMMKDKAFLAEAEKLKLDVELVPASEMIKVVQDLYATQPDVLAVVKSALAD